MPLSEPPISPTRGDASSRTQEATASAMGHRRIAGGATATELWSGSTTASSRTTSGASHSPGPVIGGNEGAIAMSLVRRSRQAEGSGLGSSVEADGSSSGGRGRGSGIFCAAATPVAQARNASETMNQQRCFTMQAFELTRETTAPV